VLTFTGDSSYTRKWHHFDHEHRESVIFLLHSEKGQTDMGIQKFFPFHFLPYMEKDFETADTCGLLSELLTQNATQCGSRPP
jgi:hypothetical protein